MAWKFKHFAKCNTIRNGLLFCDDDLLFVLSFVSKNSYLLWVVLESFRKRREILQREEKIKERVSNVERIKWSVLRFNQYFLYNRDFHLIFSHSCLSSVHFSIGFYTSSLIQWLSD